MRPFVLPLVGIALLVGCGSSSNTVEEDTTTVPGTGGSVVGGGGGPATGAGGSPGGGGAVTGTCAAPGTYAGPALTPGAWVNVSGTLPSVNRIWSVPNQDKVLATVNAKGIWAYTAAGNAWTQLKGPANNNVSQIVFDPCNGDRFWYSVTGASGGVFYTEDAGASAKKLGTGPADIGGIGVDLKVTNGQTIIASQAMGWPWGDGKAKAWVSKDGGTTWADISPALTAQNGTPFGAAYAVDDKTLLASCMTNGSWDGNNSKGGIWISKDSGETWAQAPWVDSPYCAGWAWCGYSSWNQPLGPALAVAATSEIWWVNAWQNTYFSSKDNGATWVDNWGYWDHSVGGGGQAVAVPKKYVAAIKADPKQPEPSMLWLLHRCNSHSNPCEETNKQSSILYMQKDQNGAGLHWWLPLMDSPIVYDSGTNGDQLAYNSVANALFLSNCSGCKGFVAGKPYVWMYPFAP
jgi:hypothetical protein